MPFIPADEYIEDLLQNSDVEDIGSDDVPLDFENFQFCPDFEEDESPQEYREKWERKRFMANVVLETKPLPIAKSKVPMDFFSKYFPEEIFEKMALYTRKSLKARQKKDKYCTTSLIKTFFGAHALMGVMKCPNRKVYFSHNFQYGPISKRITQEKYKQILLSLRVVDIESADQLERLTNRLWKVQPIIDTVRFRCQQLERSALHYSIGEQMIHFVAPRIATSFNYNSKQVGLKNFVVTDNHGLIVDFEIYQGSLTDLPDKSLGTAAGVVLRLARTIDACLYFGRNFTSVALMNELAERNIKATGVMMPCRFKTEIYQFKRNKGTTRLLLTRIPHFRNVVIMSFSCEHCHYENNEIQPGGAYAETGVRFELQVKCPEDLNRQVVKSDYASVVIPELDFEIPSQSQKGEVTTVEGIISRAISGLSQQQARRREEHPEDADAVENVVQRLRGLAALEREWTLRLEDISGNSFIENPAAPLIDARCKRTDFKRTPEHDHLLGVFTRDEVESSPSPVPADAFLTPAAVSAGCYDKMAADEVMQFRTNCPECNAPADTNMKVTDIPHFKQVVIMATTCDACGHRTNEVKSGAGVEPKGVRFEVRVHSRDDFSRDILKSETCSMSIPALSLSVGGRALGGRFTTAEGILRATREQLAEAPSLWGETTDSDKLDRVLSQLDAVLECRRGVSIVLCDPAGNSYVQSLHDDPNLPDDGLKITHFERSFEENEELGLNDMKTEGYEGELPQTT